MMGDDERPIDDQLRAVEAAGEELIGFVGSGNAAADDGGRSVASDDDL